MSDNLPEIITKEGKSVLMLNPGSKYQFYIGVYRAKKIVENISLINSHIFMYYNKATIKDAHLNNYKIPPITLDSEMKYPITLTMYKCLVIKENFETIKSFVNQYAY